MWISARNKSWLLNKVWFQDGVRTDKKNGTTQGVNNRRDSEPFFFSGQDLRTSKTHQSAGMAVRPGSVALPGSTANATTVIVRRELSSPAPWYVVGVLWIKTPARNLKSSVVEPVLELRASKVPSNPRQACNLKHKVTSYSVNPNKSILLS